MKAAEFSAAFLFVLFLSHFNCIIVLLYRVGYF